jgi:hypothetical protein
MTYRRRKLLRDKGDVADIYQYESMSDRLRAQVLLRLDELATTSYWNFNGIEIFQFVVDEMRQEKGVFELASSGPRVSEQGWREFRGWFLSEDDTDYLLSGLETFMRIASNLDAKSPEVRDRHIAAINAFMLEDGFGFQFEGGEIFEIGSTFVHKEVVVPLLGLLSDPKYVTVNEEFRKSHQEFKAQDYEDSIHDCCNAFESMMKIIANEQGWVEITEKSTAKDLVKALYDHDFIPSYTQQGFTGLRTILEGSINVVRNKAGGHGQGATPRVIDKQVAEYQLNQTATALKLLAEYNK